MSLVRTSGAVRTAASMGWLLSLLGCAAEPEPVGAPAARAAAVVQAEQPDAYAVFASSAPTIDGHTDYSEIWAHTTAYGLNRRIVGDAPASGHVPASFRAAWDTSALYVFVTVHDALRYNDSSLPWEDDSVEVYIDADDSKLGRYTADDYQFVFGWRDGTVVEAHGKPVDGITFAQQILGGDYQIEIRIPWLSLNGSAGRDWRTIGFDVHVNDDDDGGPRDRKWSWHAPVDSSWTDPRTFGTLGLQVRALRACTPSTDPSSDRPFEIAYAPETPILDARQDPSAAYGSAPFTFSGPVIVGSVESRDDLSAIWRLAWTETALYLLAFVTDDALYNDSYYPWEDDSVELYIDGDLSRDHVYGADDYQFVFGWNDTVVVEAHGKTTAGVAYAARTVPGGYVLEAVVPWTVINAGPAGSGGLGRAIGWDVHVNDDDDGGAREGKVSTWVLEDRAWSDPSLLAGAQLVTCE